MIKAAWFRPIIFSVNCYIASILTLFIAFSLDLKSPGWAMTTVYLTSQPISGAMRAKAIYRAIGTFVGGAAMVAIVPNLIDAPELTTAAIILWVTICLLVALQDRTPRSYMFVLSGYTAAAIGFPSVLAPGTVFDTAVSRVEEITIGVVCAALVHSLFFPKSALSAFRAKWQSSLADARIWIADGLTKAPTPQSEMERRRIAGDITELYIVATSLRFDTSPIHPDIGIIRAFDRKIVALLPLLSAIEDRLMALRGFGPLPNKIARVVTAVHDWVYDTSTNDPARAQSLHQAALAATPTITEQSPWRDLVAANVTARLAELIESASQPRSRRLSRRPDAQAKRGDLRARRAGRREAAAYRLGHRAALGAGRDRGDGHLRVLLDRHGVARGRQCRDHCRGRLHVVRDARRSDADIEGADDAFGALHSTCTFISVLHLAGGHRFRAAQSLARPCADPGRDFDGDPALQLRRRGAGSGLYRRNEPADQLHRRFRTDRK